MRKNFTGEEVAPQADEGLLRSLQSSLESRFETANLASGNMDEWERILFKWDATLSNTLQLSRPIGSLGTTASLPVLFPRPFSRQVATATHRC